MRPYLKAAEAQVKAAEKTLGASCAERLPCFSDSADIGEIGTRFARRTIPIRLGWITITCCIRPNVTRVTDLAKKNSHHIRV